MKHSIKISEPMWIIEKENEILTLLEGDYVFIRYTKEYYINDSFMWEFKGCIVSIECDTITICVGNANYQLDHDCIREVKRI